MIALYGELSTGHREIGGPKKRYKDCIKKSLTACHVDPPCWSDMAAGRDAWRHSIFKVVNEFGQERKNAQDDKGSKWKARVVSNTTPDITFTCGPCSRPCLCRIRLVCHECACSRRGQTSSSSFAYPSHYKLSIFTFFLNFSDKSWFVF